MIHTEFLAASAQRSARLHVFLFLATCVCVMLPASVQAYFTTNQHAVMLNESTGLYLIEYTFGHGTHDITLPVRAIESNARHAHTLSYSFVNDEDAMVQGGTHAGIVLSNASYTDGTYRVPAGSTATFTLMVLRSHNPDTAENVRLQVTQIPFTFDDDEHLQLNPSELTYYTTPHLTFE